MIEYYKNLLSSSKPWLVRGAIIFLIFGAIGIIAGLSNPKLIEEIAKSFAAEFGSDPALNINLARDIFLQNLSVSAVALIGGIVLGIAPFLILAFNGLLLGYIMGAIPQTIDAPYLVKVLALFLGLAPHGIVEIPAFLIAGGLGLQLGLHYLSKQSKGNRAAIFKQDIKTAFLAAPLIIALLIVAALIEVFVTGKLLA